MGIIDLILMSIALSMDASTVAICKGLSMKKLSLKKALVIAIYFGLFQGLMPILGYILGISFQDVILTIDHWVAFILLGIIGLNMTKESFEEEDKVNDSISFKTMLPLAIATSIDALAIGITLSFLKVNILLAALIITLITLIMSFIATIIGHHFGSKYGRLAERLGGLILIIIGTKILLEHLNIIN